ncbi:hypothetical protein G6N82_01205 [Altererythrobacter sp. BO-6]|uniref:hypothetical protein n=1 Tax=Altererythrobacter sp. BO-6 TaxID=2604537 RepID=UPI0013E18BF7|nr:hypothetical protein [Altererythrobacter sp. BO-6]QIG52963.1 hypothetical protein G6N82_01205 [Altererythrobacter sp. BO-6]
MALIELYSRHQQTLIQAAHSHDKRDQEALEQKADRLAEEISNILATNDSHLVELLPAAKI